MTSTAMRFGPRELRVLADALAQYVDNSSVHESDAPFPQDVENLEIAQRLYDDVEGRWLLYMKSEAIDLKVSLMEVNAK